MSSGEISMKSDTPSSLGGFTYTVSSSFEEILARRGEWDALVEEVAGNIYMSFDWCRTWWEFYGDGRELLIFFIRDTEKLVGIFPMFVERLWLGPACLRIARVVGSDHALTLADPLVAPDAARPAVEIVVGWMLKTKRVDVVAMGPLSGITWSGFPWESIGEGYAITRRAEGQYSCHTVFHLPESMDAYWKSFGSRERSNYKRRIRQLESKGEVKLRITTEPAACIERFSQFLAMHEEQWRAQGKLGHFGDWPKSADFNRVLIRRFAEGGNIMIEELRVGEQSCAYHYRYRMGKREYWRLTARLVGEDWDRSGLGTTTMLKEIEGAIERGVTYAEAGLGHYDHKVAAGGKEYPVLYMRFVANRLGARWRLAMFVKASELLHLAYYRIWFLKVAPRLPLPRKPLRRLWIRSRI